MASQTQTESFQSGEFLISEANGYRSRDDSILLTKAEVLEAGAIMEIAAGKWIELATPANAAGILLTAVDATDADSPCVALVRDCEVNRSELLYAGADEDLTDAALAALGVIVRAQP